MPCIFESTRASGEFRSLEPAQHGIAVDVRHARLHVRLDLRSTRLARCVDGAAGFGADEGSAEADAFCHILIDAAESTLQLVRRCRQNNNTNIIARIRVSKQLVSYVWAIASRLLFVPPLLIIPAWTSSKAALPQRGPLRHCSLG